MPACARPPYTRSGAVVAESGAQERDLSEELRRLFCPSHVRERERVCVCVCVCVLFIGTQCSNLYTSVDTERGKEKEINEREREREKEREGKEGGSRRRVK